MMEQPTVVRRVLFLPGASGVGSFWEPTARLLPTSWQTECLDWPGLGTVPADPRVRQLEDLADLVLDRIASDPAVRDRPDDRAEPGDPVGPVPGGSVEPVLGDAVEPVDLVAQSMGGVVAMLVALRRPDLVRRLVLAGTSGGIDLSAFGIADWRPNYRQSFPSAAHWVTEFRGDLSAQIRTIQAPTLLLWGGADDISPPSVGAYLASLLPNARLVVIPGGDHMFPRDRAAEVAPHILHHLDQIAYGTR